MKQAGLAVHPAALLEVAEAAEYYEVEGSSALADDLVSAIQSAFNEILAAPARWRLVRPSGVRRFVLRRFPYVIYYTWQASTQRVVIYALMHGSRKPGYWLHRTKDTLEA